MRRTCEVLTVLCLLALVVTLFGCGGGGTPGMDTMAKGKPPSDGGGGGGSTPPGTIYFTSDGLTWTMDGDGNNKTPLPAGVEGEPSRELHGGQRWFLKVVGGQLTALGADGTPAGAPLIDDASIVVLDQRVRWSNGDTVASCVAMAADESATGIYSVLVDWQSGAPAAGSAPGLELACAVYSHQGTPYPAIHSHDWSPDGQELVYDLFEANGDGAGIWVLSAGVSQLASPDGWDPNWSPDTANPKIAFETIYYSIDTVSPDGSQRKTILRGSYTPGMLAAVVSYDTPCWSPTGEHVACTRTDYKDTVRYDRDVIRAKADGKAKADLTTDVDVWTRAVAWR